MFNMFIHAAAQAAAAGGGGTPLTCVYQLNDDGTVAGSFGYLHLATNDPDYQRADQVLSSSDTASNNVYLGLADDPLASDAVNPGSDVVAFGFEEINHTGDTANIFTGGTFAGFGIFWASGTKNYAMNSQVNGSSNRNHKITIGTTETLGQTTVSDTGGELGTDIQKIAMYFNGSTGQIGYCYYDFSLGQWVDKGYDATATFSGNITPYMFVDNDSVPVPALDGATVSVQIRTDKTWLAECPLPAGAKTVCLETI